MKVKFIHNLRYWSLRILFILGVLFLCYLFYFFYLPEINIGETTVGNPFYSYVISLKWWQYIVVYTTFLSVFSVIVFLVLSLYVSTKKEYFKKRRFAYRLLLSEKLIEYIYGDIDDNRGSGVDFINFFKEEIKTNLSKEVLFSVIVELQETVADNLSGKLTRLFEELRLEKDLIYFLYSRNMSEKIIAIKVISYLNIKGFEDILLKYSKSNNYVLRTEAIPAIIRLMGEEGLKALLHHKYPISKLDVNVIVNAILNNKIDKIDYISMFKSENPRLLAIGLLLVKFNSKAEYKYLVREVLHNKSEYLRDIAWDVFSFLATSKDDFIFMTENFDMETSGNKLTIIKGLSRSVDIEYFYEFLDKVVERERGILKKEALDIFFENSIERLYSYRESKNKDVVAAYKEVIDINLN